MPPSAERMTRPLAEVEADLLAAEKAFEDAVNRMNDAKRDLETALGRINQHQAELDDAVAALRERSPLGSRWKATPGNDELLLRTELGTNAQNAPLSENIESLTVQFDRLRAFAADSSDEDAEGNRSPRAGNG